MKVYYVTVWKIQETAAGGTIHTYFACYSLKASSARVAIARVMQLFEQTHDRLDDYWSFSASTTRKEILQ